MWIWYGWIYLVAGYFVLVFASYLVLEYKRYESPENVAIVENEEPGADQTAYSKMPPTPKESKDHENVIEIHDVDDIMGGVPTIRVPVEPTGRGISVPVTLAFHNLWYSVPLPGSTNDEQIDLLKGVSGFALPGTMTALMGSSGAGKTTLMDVIAGRKTGGRIQGKILLHGHPANDLAIRRCTGYCEQMDIHSDSATVREALIFSAMLRQDANISAAQKMESVEECIELLELGPIADKIIRGSSTEQMKRVTIGVELAAQPSIIFMDEPTSGLDARSAKLIMNGVRKIADSGRTIVCTIHQPSTEVFNLFDSLLLLRRGGRMVFFGELGEDSKNLINYFEAFPGVNPIKPGYNPATWMLECIGAGVGGGKAATNVDPSQPTDFADRFLVSDQKVLMEEDLDQDGVLRPSPHLPELKFINKRASSGYIQFDLLCRRFFRMYWRTPTYNLTRLMISVRSERWHRSHLREHGLPGHHQLQQRHARGRRRAHGVLPRARVADVQCAVVLHREHAGGDPVYLLLEPAVHDHLLPERRLHGLHHLLLLLAGGLNERAGIRVPGPVAGVRTSERGGGHDARRAAELHLHAHRHPGVAGAGRLLGRQGGLRRAAERAAHDREHDAEGVRGGDVRHEARRHLAERDDLDHPDRGVPRAGADLSPLHQPPQALSWITSESSIAGEILWLLKAWARRARGSGGWLPADCTTINRIKIGTFRLDTWKFLKTESNEFQSASAQACNLHTCTYIVGSAHQHAEGIITPHGIKHKCDKLSPRMRRRVVLLLVVVALLANCGAVSASNDQTKSVRSGDTTAEETHRLLLSHKKIEDGVADEERGIGSTIKKLLGMDGLSRRAIKKAIQNEQFRLELYKKWDKLTMREIIKKVNADKFHPREKKLLLDYLNEYKKSPASPTSVKRPHNARNVAFGVENHVRIFDKKGEIVPPDKVVPL
ncbi:hypothetical protein ON010_g14823 [Phytophthora cinnamomi]|nr:hypothetical protein ON010_g14823 [Phytophthora cinnamomi]